MNFLEIKNLCLKLGSFELKNINLSLAKGEFLSIIGRSGSGKTVLLESIAGLHKAEGEIWLEGYNIIGRPPQKRGVRIVYQDYMLFSNMNVKQNILYPSLFHKNGNTLNMFEEIVSFLKINGILSRSVKNLSGGEKQRVAIARALLSNPKLLLFDEPLNAVDLSFKFSFMEFLKKLHKKYNLTILYVTHNFKEAMFFSQRSAVMLDGAILRCDSVENLFKHPKDRRVAELLGFKNILPLSLIGENTHNFFSVSPEDIEISNIKPNKDYTFEVEVQDIFKIKNHYSISVSFGEHRFSVNTDTKDFESKKLYIGFDKKDTEAFD